MGAGALAGFTIDFQVKATNVNNFLGANWFDIWKLIDTEDKGFVKTEVVRDFIAANAGKFTSPEFPTGFFAPILGADGKIKHKVYLRAFLHTTLRDGGHQNTNVYDYEFRRLCRYLFLMNELSVLCGETEAEEKTLNKADFRIAQNRALEDENLRDEYERRGVWTSDDRPALEPLNAVCEAFMAGKDPEQRWPAPDAGFWPALPGGAPRDGPDGDARGAAAVEHALGDSRAAPTVASMVAREFGAKLLAKLVEGQWDRAIFHRHAVWRGVLVQNIGRALDWMRLVGDQFRRPRPAAPDAPRALTAEQEAYAAEPLDPANNDVILVKAYAGTGKSHSTLEFVARRHGPESPVLVAYFNAAMAAEMRLKLTATIPGGAWECATLDALVQREFLRQVPSLAARKFHDASKSGPAITSQAVRRCVGISDGAYFSGTIATHTKRVLAIWVNSDKRHFGDAIIPYSVIKWWHARSKAMPPFLELAQLWRGILSLAESNDDLKLSFGEVAKCFALRPYVDEPDVQWMLAGRGDCVLRRLSPFEGARGYAYVVIDEAQDLNPPHLELFVSAPRRNGDRVAHAIVGDPYQSLYAWRGARNALKSAAPLATTTVSLTKSFRFGPAVACLATAVLQECEARPEGSPKPPPLEGVGPDSRLHMRNDIACHDYTQSPLAVLARSNKSVMEEANAYALRAGDDAAPFLFLRGQNLGKQRMIVNVLAVAIIDRVQAASVAVAEDARVVLGTVHSFKGLEGTAVRLLDDIVPSCTERMVPRGLSNPDLCLIYTALTRARDELYLNKGLRKLWLTRRPPRPVLRLAPPPPAPAPDDDDDEPLPELPGWCGLCGNDVPSTVS
ncbi:ATP-dependent DNA helicase [Aureococcus anophagefferens]|nr:ATP-dependent DNA helicase [Aureococcus anophagefferens]